MWWGAIDTCGTENLPGLSVTPKTTGKDNDQIPHRIIHKSKNRIVSRHIKKVWQKDNRSKSMKTVTQNFKISEKIKKIKI